MGKRYPYQAAVSGVKKTSITNNMVLSKKIKIVTVATLFFLFNLFPCIIHAEFFKYKDKDGNIHFVDDKTKIPEQYIDKIKGYKEQYDNLSKEKREVMLQEDADFETDKKQELKQAEQLVKQQEQIEKQRYIQSMTTKVKIIGNQVLVPSKINYNGHVIDALLLLDTGASITALHHDLFDQAGLMHSSKNIKMLGAGGNIIKSRFVKLNYIRIGPVKKTNVGAVVIERKGPPVIHDGLLGMNFLRHLEYSTDFENHTITWLPKGK